MTPRYSPSPPPSTVGPAGNGPAGMPAAPQPQPAAPPPMRSGRGRRLMKFLLLLILIAAAGYGGYSSQHKQVSDLNKKLADANTQITRLDSQNFNLQHQATPPAADPYVGWTNFSNTTYNLSFKYPKGVTVTDTSSKDLGSGSNFPWYSQSSYAKLSLTFTGLGTTYAKLVVNDSDIAKIMGAFGGTGKVSKQYTINGLAANYIINYGNGGGNTPGIEYTVVGPKYTFVIQSSDNTHNDTIDQILQSLSMK